MEKIMMQSKFSKLANTKNSIEQENIIILSIIKATEDEVFIEYIDNKDMIYFENEQKEKSQAPKSVAKKTKSKEIIEAENTILIKDPFGHGLNGKTLKEIVETDPVWCKMCLEEMQNEYIRNRVQILVEFYG